MSQPTSTTILRCGKYVSIYIITTIIFMAMGIADERTSNWEFGLGFGGLSTPHYRGSDQSKTYVAPLPYVKYHGEYLTVDREGARLNFYEQAGVTLDVSAGFNFPVDSVENIARQGMPGLDPVLELGPRAQFDLLGTAEDILRIRIALPVRLATSASLKGFNDAGWTFTPYIQLRYRTAWETAISFGPVYASEKYNDYYYQVAPEYIQPGRPAYDARDGFSSFRFTLTTSRRLNQSYWFGAFMRYDNLSGTVILNSPLVKQVDSVFWGAGITYIFNKKGNDIKW